MKRTCLARWLKDRINPAALRLAFFGGGSRGEVKEALDWERN